MCLKTWFGHSKWVLHAIFSLTVLSNCVFDTSSFDTAFPPDCTQFFSVFFMSLDRKFSEDSKNMLKTVIFSLQVGFTSNFVLDCLFKLSFWQLKLWHHFFPRLYQIFECFLRLLDRKFSGDSKNVLKTVIFPLQVGFTRNFVPECSFKLSFWHLKLWHHFSRRLYQIF